MRGVISHLRYTVRQLLKSPGFTVTAVLILGLGIGANTAIFSLVNGVLLKPLPYPNADRLFHLYRTFKNSNTTDFDYPDFADYCASQHSFAALAAYDFDWFHLSSQGSVEQIPGLYVSGAFFGVMGRTLILGRPLDESDNRPGSAAVVVLSEHLWRTHFNSDPDIVGVFSAAALALAIVGLYGVLSYSVSLRKRELSVRIALGAQASNILGLVVGQGLRIAGIGLTAGLITALLLNRLIEGTLFGVSAADPISFGASVLVLVAAALAACLLPALRATRIDPIRTLRG